MKVSRDFSRSLKRSLSFLIPALILLGLALFPSAPARAGWRSLTGVLPDFTDLRNVRVSPDSQTVIFIADIDQKHQHELYSVPINGERLPKKLNPTLVKGGGVDYAEISPDGSRVIYRADQEVDERRELYSVPIEGGEALKLNGPLVSGGNVYYFRFDEKHSRVMYVADQDINDVNELYSAPLEGGEWIKINSPLAAGGNLYTFAFQPLSDRVVYIARISSGGLYQLYSVYYLGGSLYKINQPVSKDVLSFGLTPESSIVLYIARDSGSSHDELFANDLTGTNKLKRNVGLGTGENVIAMKISPDGKQVVYNVARNNSFYGDLWRTEPLSGGSQQLTPGATAGYGAYGYGFYFTSDSQRIVYLYQQESGKPFILQSVRADGGILSRQDLYSGEKVDNINRFQLSPDNQWVVLEDWGSTQNVPNLYAVPTIGGGQVPLGAGATWQISPDSQRVVFTRYGPNREIGDLLSSQIFGGGLRNLSLGEVGEYAYNPVFSPDGKWVVYEVVLAGGSGYELRVSDGEEPLPVTPTATVTETPTVTTTPPSGSQEIQLYLPFLRK